jgi:hypothetical protein
MKRKLFSVAAVAACLALAASPLLADSIFNGTLYYTNFQGGGDNVNKVTYSYDQTTQSLTMGTATGIAQTPGADGIVFDPQGNLLIGGQGTGQVYQVNPSNGSFTGVAPATTGKDQSSYHLTVNGNPATLHHPAPKRTTSKIASIHAAFLRFSLRTLAHQSAPDDKQN